MNYSKEFLNWVDDISEKCLTDTNVIYQTFLQKEIPGIIVADIVTGETGLSHCYSKNEFNRLIGIAIAYAKLRKIPIPEIKSFSIVQKGN